MMYRNIYFAIYFICWFFNLLNAACLYNKETQNVKRLAPYHFRIYNNNVGVLRNKLEPFEICWVGRKNAVIAAMQENCLEKPTIITVQGALVNQVNDIINGLNKNKDTDWKYFGYGADDGAEAGEFNPIIYDSNEWTLESGSQVWISPTPDEPSLFPGATQKRTFTMATFKHNSRRIRIINGQFDDEIDEARDFGARFIELYARKLMQDGYLTIVTGGINSAKGSYPHELFTKNLSDCSKKFLPRYSTYSSFSIIRGETMDLETIDFVFVDARSIATMNYQVIDNISDGLFRFSDHRPVIADLFI